MHFVDISDVLFCAQEPQNSSKPVFREKVLPQAAELLGTSGFFQKKMISWKKFCPRQRSCPGQVVSSKKVPIFCQKFCPRQRSCPAQVASYKNNRFSGKSSVPGSEAARDKWLLQKKTKFEKTFCPRQRSCPGQVVSSKKSIFWKKFCHRQRSCPGQVARSRTSGLFKKKKTYFLIKSSAPGSKAAQDKCLVQKNDILRKNYPRQRSCPGQVVCSKKSHF